MRGKPPRAVLCHIIYSRRQLQGLPLRHKTILPRPINSTKRKSQYRFRLPCQHECTTSLHLHQHSMQLSPQINFWFITVPATIPLKGSSHGTQFLFHRFTSISIQRKLGRDKLHNLFRKQANSHLPRPVKVVIV